MSEPEKEVLPDWFFERVDSAPDDRFYAPPRLVTHIDEGAIEAVGALYAELDIDGGTPGRRVLDLMSSWVSHLRSAPEELVVLGMNTAELDANPMATERVVHDLNADARLPFESGRFDAVLCCVSIDYLVRPIEVMVEAGRVLRPGGVLVITFSNRCFPTKAVRGWMVTDDAGRCALVADYVERSQAFGPPDVSRRTPVSGYRGDPLYAVVARRRPEKGA